MKKFKKVILKILIIIGILLCIFIIASDNEIKIREYSITTDKASDSVKLLLITDLHSVIYGENQSLLIEKIDEINPQVILLGGDIYDDHRNDEGSDILLSNIGSRYECYYVSGNHEYWSLKIDSIKEKITDYGITVLAGNGVEIGENVMLWGIDDADCGAYKSSEDWYEELHNCGLGISTDMYNILLSHRPERTEDYQNSNFDLVLCGHAHGGQWRIPYVLNGLYAPNQGLFPKYAGGEYDFEHNKMIVSRGLALSIIPRFFNPPELVVVNIG